MISDHFTERAKQAIRFANEYAKRFGHEYIGCEDMLLGLLKEGTGVAANVLNNLGVNLRRLSLETERLIPSGCSSNPAGKQVIDAAVEEAAIMAQGYVGTEHLLLGIVRHRDSIGAKLLLACGCNPENIQAELLRLLGRAVNAEWQGGV